MKSLIVTDIQNDFLPGGALAVNRGDEVIPLANLLMPRFDLVVATQDWHPAHHGSFASRYPGRKPGEVIDLNGLPQILWPDHCIQGTRGAAFADTLDVGRIDRVFHKGVDPDIDSYSGFFDNGHRKATGLADFLKARGVTEVYLLGLATDYCVKFTALDARSLGFKACLIQDACRSVELHSGDVQRAQREMQNAGVRIVESQNLLTEQQRCGADE